ncbi:hypothetical protein DPEC_G00360720 [Dallia pectoralis]|uniref:Uncharacterized protein n=1 Tax=Dallia pectoralis TaxID=75939 RepID=A0ACC2F0Y6_DALPE|nr:hypothetical protein DPEC_G00360720 [Dallia pectoralis]
MKNTTAKSWNQRPSSQKPGHTAACLPASSSSGSNTERASPLPSSKARCPDYTSPRKRQIKASQRQTKGVTTVLICTAAGHICLPGSALTPPLWGRHTERLAGHLTEREALVLPAGLWADGHRAQAGASSANLPLTGSRPSAMQRRNKRRRNARMPLSVAQRHFYSV